MEKKITTYEEMLRYKSELKFEISEIETEIKNNKLIRLSSSFMQDKSIKQPLFDSLSSINFKDLLTGPIGSIISTYLMSNKITRKFFISFTIFKDLVPFALEKIKQVLDQSDLNSKDGVR